MLTSKRCLNDLSALMMGFTLKNYAQKLSQIQECVDRCQQKYYFCIFVRYPQFFEDLPDCQIEKCLIIITKSTWKNPHWRLAKTAVICRRITQDCEELMLTQVIIQSHQLLKLQLLQSSWDVSRNPNFLSEKNDFSIEHSTETQSEICIPNRYWELELWN